MNRKSFKTRSDEAEIMDDLALPEPELKAALGDLKRVNSLLGGHAVALAGLKPFLHQNAAGPCHILDIGCGDGEFLRHLSRFCLKRGISVKLTGWDRNAESLEAGREKNGKEFAITYELRDVLEFPELPKGPFVIVCNLFMHHFQDNEILKMLSHWKESECKAIVINDLDRNPAAYYLFRLFGVIFMKSKVAIHDGLISIQRGFRSADLMRYSREAGIKTFQVRWKWAFRYLWILNLKEKE